MAKTAFLHWHRRRSERWLRRRNGFARQTPGEAELVETIEARLEFGCPYEFVLKDVGALGRDPANLACWADLATAVVDRYY